jgi:hypothetical protein
MKKTLPVLSLAAAVFVVALALSSGYADKALGKSTCPSGTQKFIHVCIEKTARQADDFQFASADCADERRRLPTGAELDSFRQQPGVELAFVLEWTGDIFDGDQTLAMTDAGVYANLSQGSNSPYRCVK